MAPRYVPSRGQLNHDFTNPGGEEIELTAPERLDKNEFQCLLDEANSQGWFYIPEKSANGLGDEVGNPHQHPCGDEDMPFPVAFADSPTEGDYQAGELVTHDMSSFLPMDTTKSAVAIIVQAHDGTVENAVALIALTKTANPVNVLDAISWSMEPHVRPVALMLNTFTHASAMVYTADEPATTSECEYGNSQLGCLLLGTWEELEATVLWTRLPQCKSGTRRMNALVMHPDRLPNHMPLYFLYVKEVVSYIAITLMKQVDSHSVRS